MCRNPLVSHRCTRSKAAAEMNEDMIESFRAMIRAVRVQADTTTFMVQQMINGNGYGNGNEHSNGHREVDYEYIKFSEFHKANLLSF